jgi:hypothetical protein
MREFIANWKIIVANFFFSGTPGGNERDGDITSPTFLTCSQLHGFH